MLSFFQERKPSYLQGLTKAVDLLAPYVQHAHVPKQALYLQIGGLEYTLDVGTRGAGREHPVMHLWLTCVSPGKVMVLDNVDIYLNRTGDIELAHFDMLGLLVGDRQGHDTSAPEPNIPYT
jgi:hypothetical protein